ncbi:AraC family transcriptional regulator ligand-binding domain-containing protein [Xanthobacter sp. DSM 24535]|uniref:AraC family transcriptional regulator n=1 Tax=Roseixanthobacter psychrophilus TaxID=3119917 RepID=UPI0037277735
MYPSSLITTSATQALVSTIAGKGTDTGEVIAKLGMAQENFCGSSSFLPLATFTSILESAAEVRGDATFGVELGKAFRHEGLGPIALLFLTSRTVGDALEKFTRCFPSVQSNTKHALTISNGIARLAYLIADPAVRFRVQDANFTLAIEYSMLARLLGPGRRMACVELEHLPGEDLEVYRDHFACPVKFGGRENAICFPAEYLDIPIASADLPLNARIETELCEVIRTNDGRLDLVCGIEAWMTACLAHSTSIDIEYAASDFGMSLRSFQRKLAEHGVSYMDLRNKVRFRIAKCILAETSISITSLALYLGYSETSAFSRSFRQHVGMTAATFRARAHRFGARGTVAFS